MTRMPGHLANLSDEPLVVPETLPAAHGLGLKKIAENVRAHGGDPDRFAAALVAGLALFADETPSDRADTLVLVAVAGWRAGAVALRDDALARAGAITTKEMRTAVAAVFGIDTDLEEFVAKQSTDRYWWPGRDDHDGYVCTLGGFAGLGGAWIEPPVEVLSLAEPGAFGIRTGQDWWRADIDVWGSRLTALPGAPEGKASTPEVATIEVMRDSYLASVRVGAPS